MRRAWAGLAAVLGMCAWAGVATPAPDPSRGDAPDSAAAQLPRAHDSSYLYDLIDHSFVRPATRVLDVARLGRRLTGHPREAVNVDANDDVRLPSTWWQLRLGYRTVTPEQVLHGPGPGTGPAPGRWTITKSKGQGVSAGFQIRDAAGATFVIKFDDPRFPCASSAADVIGSHLVWAAGYNVPDNAIAYLVPDSLDIAPGTTFADARGRRRPLTAADVRRMLATVAPPVDGRYRCLASRFVAGKPIGPFAYEGRRKDDPEDRIPHELRRELRGLWTIAAWINHTDSRSANTLDSWVTDHGRSFVRHYLIDFGSTLGSGTDTDREYSEGFEYYFDYGAAARSAATLGLAPARWESVTDPHMPSVGVFESRRFDPVGWRPDYPNPAFDERTVRDIRWGARIVAAFTDDDIRAVVEAAQLPNPRAADYLTRTLIERRDKLVHHWLGGSVVPATEAGSTPGTAAAPARSASRSAPAVARPGSRTARPRPPAGRTSG